MDKTLIKKALEHLKIADQVILLLINKYGACTLKPSLDNPFNALVNSIISQQLSNHAAKAITKRLYHIIGTDQLTPDLLLKNPIDSLKSAGLSRLKVESILNLALAIKKGDLDFSIIKKYDDEDVISKLIMLQGIGRWTAEMFLIFGLGRANILSVNDAGLKRGFKIAYNLPKIPSTDKMISISESWKPYRSIGCWYIWRTLD